MPLPRFLDVEASSLKINSYPIEIAWSDPDGSIESHLINPYAVDSWIDWDCHAQQLHGITRRQCREKGIHPKFLCRLMSELIRPGEIIYSDGGQFDQEWVDTLFVVGSKLGYSQFRIVHSDSVILPLLIPIESDKDKRWQLYHSLKIEARKKVGGQKHRAAIDVQFLIALYGLCVSQVTSP